MEYDENEMFKEDMWGNNWDRIRNEEIRRRIGVLSDLAGRVEKCVLRWFGSVERMEGEWRGCEAEEVC